MAVKAGIPESRDCYDSAVYLLFFLIICVLIATNRMGKVHARVISPATYEFRLRPHGSSMV